MIANRQEESSIDPSETQSPATVVQPRPVTNDGPAIVDLVIDDLRERAKIGEAKYGTKLQARNGRVAIVDAYQEVLDLAQYIRQEIEERRRADEIPASARRRVLYFAAPLRPTGDEIAAEVTGGHPTPRAEATSVNLRKAQRAFMRLRHAFPETTLIAPWISSVLSGEDDRDPAQREAGLVDACAVVERCDGIVLWGARLSDGMCREMEHGVRSRDLFEVYNMVGGRWQIALTDTHGMGLTDWYSRETSCHHSGL